MIKKFIFIMSVVLFGLNTFASGQGMDHMSDMMHSDSEATESNLIGSVELKYKFNGFSDDGNSYPSYRARIGWKGEINENLKWKVKFTSSREEKLFPRGQEASEGEQAPVADHVLPSPGLEQAYVAYIPVEGFVIKAGQLGWKPKFHKTGVLYDDDVYSKGVLVKYHTGDDTGRFYAKAMLKSNPFYSAGSNLPNTLIKGKLGGKYAFSDDIQGGAYVVADYDSLFEERGDAAKTTVQLGLNLSMPSMAVPVGLFGSLHTSVQEFGFRSWTFGAYAGQAGSPTSGEQGDFGVAASYYTINSGDFRTYLMDTDYVTQPNQEGTYAGVAARAQYNLWDKVNVALKYAYQFETEQDGNNLVGELTFNF